ncbi:hypothetical protein WJX73_001363 [Symbiochloris irregularis]|uniref:Uncharacterized protein n=1 Tax=Symbiochloris irregularis TaxID=706552 RepID=A0AAW1NT84_9CHLO
MTGPDTTIPAQYRTQHIPAAGIQSDRSAGGAAASLRHDSGATTPQELTKFRYLSQQPGQTLRHFGTANDKLPAGPFGVTSNTRETAAEALQQGADSKWSAWKQQQAENTYASNTQQPLGQTVKRGHHIPAGLGDTTAFGKPLHALELERAGQAKHAIYAHSAEHPWLPSQDQASPNHSMYVKTHSAFAAGEQRKRDYNWSAAGIDPNTHAFGLSHGQVQSNFVSPELRAALKPEQQEAVNSNECQLRHSASQRMPLGRPCPLPCADRSLPADFTYGSTSKATARGSNTAQVPEGMDTLSGSRNGGAAAQGIDAGLGKSIREGWKNTDAPQRVFGLPSIRRDVAPPEHPSVANTMAYGNDASMNELMHQGKPSEAAREFQQTRTAAEIRQLLQDNDIHVPEGDFSRAFAASAAIDGVSDGLCCLATFLRQHQKQLGRT